MKCAFSLMPNCRPLLRERWLGRDIRPSILKTLDCAMLKTRRFGTMRCATRPYC